MTLARQVLMSLLAATVAAVLLHSADAPRPRTAEAATINVACNTTALIQAIEAANNEGTNPGPDTLELAAGCTYTLTSAYGGGANGLPAITTDVTINGNGSTIQRDPAAVTRFRLISVAYSLTLNDLTMQGGRAPNGVGAGQPGANGGGILAAGSLFLNRSTVIANEAGNGGDNGILGGNGGGGGSGGGIWVSEAATITDSTISGNTAGHGGNARLDAHATGHIGGDGGDGGGILVAAGVLSVTNSTVVGNSAGNGGAGYNPGGDGGSGGGFFVSGTGFGGLANVTASNNSAGGAQNGAPGSGGGAYLAALSSVVAKNTIIANSNVGGNCSGTFYGGSATNLATDGTCGASFGQSTQAAVNLGPLADNGGPTFTMAFNLPSVAIDAGDNTTCAAAPVNNLDQRGVTRPIDGDNNGSAVCDLGAFESPALQADPNFVVNTTSEEDDGACHPLPLDCSLREAINAANANASLSIITLGSAETYTLTSSLPQISFPLTINGNGSTIYRDFPAPRFRVITSSASSLTLNNVTIRGGRAPEGFPAGANGGGVSVTGSLVLNNSLVIDNEAGTGSDNPFLGGTGGSGGNGGGVWVSGDATIANSTISGNSAGHGGTALANGGIGGDAGYGGGVYVSSGSLNVTNSTIVGNSAGNGGYGANPGGDGGNGGGFYVPAGSSGTLTNVTMSNNSAGGAQNGAPGSGGGVYLTAGSSIAAKNTIITTSNIGGNCSGAFGAASTNNLSSDSSCGGSFTLKNFVEINLGPLQDNGGPTFTMVPRQPSAAIDAGSNAVCAAAPVNNLDQRGVVRPIDGDSNGSAICDIGAYEAPPLQSPPTFTVNSTAPDDDSLCQLPPDDCTLREAINAANGDGVASTVVLGNGQVYALNAVDNGSSGLPLITTDITIQGNGSTIARDGGAPQFRIFEVAGPGILRLNAATITGGYAPDSNTQGGGAIFVGPTGAADITASTISGNRAGDGTLGALNGKPGGGIFATSATLSLTDSTVTGNAAGNGAVGSTGAGGLGGGIYFSGVGTLTVNRSTMAGNVAGDGGSVGGPAGWGGGLFIQAGATASITNSTIANNTAGDGGAGNPGGGGGGIHNQAISLAMTNVTLSGNAVGSGTIPGLGGNISTGTAIVAKNTIVSAPALGENCAGAPFNVASATNMASDATCGPSFTQQTAGQINLGALANNGGPTQTMALISPSSAIDFGDNAICAAAPVSNLDQRGDLRPLDGDGNGSAVCDAGSYERCAGYPACGDLTVDTTSDANLTACTAAAADCSFRGALNSSSSLAGRQKIRFDIPPGGVQTITITGAFWPDVTAEVTIDGTTQPGYAGTPIIELNGNSFQKGLRVTAGNSIIRGLVLNRFGLEAIQLQSGGNSVGNSYIGTDPAGAIDLGNVIGISIEDVAGNCIGGLILSSVCTHLPGDRNVISGNGSGIQINGPAAAGNVILGNYIGTNANGTAGLGNSTGVYVNYAGGSGNSIGTTAGTEPGGACAGGCNLISGNIQGIRINETLNTQVLGNYVGTDVTGNADIGNFFGIDLEPGNTAGTVIGDGTSGGRNVISGNNNEGVNISSGGVTIRGNYVGTNSAGNADLGNGQRGVGLFNAASNNVIGGSASGQGNVISGNNGGGIGVQGTNVIKGNLIGTAADGTTALGNTGIGVNLASLAVNNLIGGTAPGEGNTIAFNSGEGVRVDTGDGNTIRGNSIHSNGASGIDSVNGGNEGLAPPVITALGSASGTACANCTVDIYSGNDDEGKVYHGSAVADGAGNWSYSGAVGGPNVTATATNLLGSTSKFSCIDTDFDGICPPNDPDDDNDGFTDVAEAGTPLCDNALNDDPLDDAVANDGCPGGPAQAGAFSEAQFKIGTNSLYPCGFNSWPADLWDQLPLSANKITVQDLTSFIAPLRRLSTSPGDANFNSRWDLVPGKGIFSNTINVQDMTALVTLAPPMLNGVRALNGPVCPLPSQ